MSKVITQIVNPLGLHARPAAKLVDCASHYASNIRLEYNNKNIDAKSIMSVMMLAAPFGAQITLHIEGKDEKQAQEAILKMFASGFGELE